VIGVRRGMQSLTTFTTLKDKGDVGASTCICGAPTVLFSVRLFLLCTCMYNQVVNFLNTFLKTQQHKRMLNSNLSTIITVQKYWTCKVEVVIAR